MTFNLKNAKRWHCGFSLTGAVFFLLFFLHANKNKGGKNTQREGEAAGLQKKKKETRLADRSRLPVKCLSLRLRSELHYNRQNNAFLASSGPPRFRRR